MPEPSDYSSAFAEQLAALGVEAKLIGALAALRYRRVPRATTDVDFLARTLAGVPEAMRERGYDVKVMIDDGEAYAVFVRGKGVRVDILRAETQYQHEALDRARGADVITVEDVVVHKLLAWRARDIDDITDILAAGHDLDDGYIERWARAWGVDDRWNEVVRTR